MNLNKLKEYHTYSLSGYESVDWRIEPIGLKVGGFIDVTGDNAARAGKIWGTYKAQIMSAAKRFDVPAELIIATIATESGGNSKALRKEPKYSSDTKTPHQVSAGLMQTLISTAQMVMPGVRVTREWLFDPQNSIDAGTAYIAQQADKTDLDPPKVAAAYNAGGVYLQKGVQNRWKMRQYPIGTGKHVDRFVRYFNDCFQMWGRDGGAPEGSFVQMLKGPGSTVEPIRTDPPKKGTNVMSGIFGKLFGGSGIIRTLIGGFLGAVGVEQGLGGDIPGVATQTVDFSQVIMLLVVGLLNERLGLNIPTTTAPAEKAKK